MPYKTEKVLIRDKKRATTHLVSTSHENVNKLLSDERNRLPGCGIEWTVVCKRFADPSIEPANENLGGHLRKT